MIESPVERFALYVVMYGGGIVIGALLLALVVRVLRSTRASINRTRGAERPAWAPGIWMCAACRSSNAPTAPVCRSCRSVRRELERVPVMAPADVVPHRIQVPPGAVVMLHHEPGAHADGEAVHWRLAVGGVTVGSAAGRDGVRALLRVIEDRDVVLLDIRGDGAAPYRLGEVQARFDGARFPLDVPCPEAATWSAAV